jgi:hypothetical protein
LIPVVEVVYMGAVLEGLVVLLEEYIQVGPEWYPRVVSKECFERGSLDCSIGGRVVAEHQRPQVELPVQRSLVVLAQHGP